MRNLLGKTRSLVIGGLCVAGALPLSATTLYNNLYGGTGLGHVDPGLSQVGDQVVMSGGSPFNLSQFAFQYWASSANSSSFASDVQVQVSFYANDGTPFQGYATPHTLLGQSSWFSLPFPTWKNPNPNENVYAATLVYDANEFAGLQTLPANFTWAVQFKGLGTGDHVGVENVQRAPGAPGMDFPDYWYNAADSLGWELLRYDSIPVNFGAAIDGVVVPEPSTWIASSLLLLPLAGTFMRLRKTEQKEA